MARIEVERTPDPDSVFKAEEQYVLVLEDVEKDASGRPLLSRRCVGLDELDKEITRIKTKLDEIQKKARERWGSKSA